MFSTSLIGGPIVNDPENANAIDALQRRLTTNPNVIPFIGAGLSRPFGYPDWREFLQKGADLVDKRGDVDCLVSQGDYESAMSVIHRELEGINYFDFLRNTFGPRKASGETRNAAVRFLPAMPKTPIVTTNIDGVLEQVFEEHGAPLEVIVGARRDRIRTAIEEKQRCLIKLHGDYRDQSDQILTLEDYKKHYGSDTSAARKQLPFVGVVQNLLAGNSFLFLGFKMEERTSKLLKSIAEQGGLHSHWILLPRSSQPEHRNRAKELGRSNVRTLWYDEAHYEHIGAFLHWFTCTAAPVESPLHRFYSAIAAGNYSTALTAGREAISNGFGDPALSWNISVTTEFAAHELFARGKLTEGMQLLEESISGHEYQTQSAVALQWAISYTLNLAQKSENKPADVKVSTLETLSLLRQAVVDPTPDLLSDSNYQQALKCGISDGWRTLCLLSQMWQGDGREVEDISRDSLVEAAQRAAMLRREFSARADGVEGRLKLVKKAYYKTRAKQQEDKFKEARLAFAVRQVASLSDLKPQREWYNQHSKAIEST
jgi:NAD-dependent SIR2 family protein deacetylase